MYVLCIYVSPNHARYTYSTMEQIIIELVTTHIVIKIVVLPGHGPRVEAPSVRRRRRGGEQVSHDGE